MCQAIVALFDTSELTIETIDEVARQIDAKRSLTCFTAWSRPLSVTKHSYNSHSHKIWRCKWLLLFIKKSFRSCSNVPASILCLTFSNSPPYACLVLFEKIFPGTNLPKQFQSWMNLQCFHTSHLGKNSVTSAGSPSLTSQSPGHPTEIPAQKGAGFSDFSMLTKQSHTQIWSNDDETRKRSTGCIWYCGFAIFQGPGWLRKNNLPRLLGSNDFCNHRSDIHRSSWSMK